MVTILYYTVQNCNYIILNVNIIWCDCLIQRNRLPRLKTANGLINGTNSKNDKLDLIILKLCVSLNSDLSEHVIISKIKLPSTPDQLTRLTAVLISDCRLSGKPSPRFTVPSNEPVKVMPWKPLALLTFFRNAAKCPSGMGWLFRHSTLAIASLTSETDMGRMRSLHCIWKLSLLRIENKPARKWQNVVKWTSLILPATNFARPWMSAFFEEMLRCSMWNNTAAYCLASSQGIFGGTTHKHIQRTGDMR